MRILNKYYTQGTVDTRTFILDNLLLLYNSDCDIFPIGFFL